MSKIKSGLGLLAAATGASVLIFRSATHMAKSGGCKMPSGDAGGTCIPPKS